jgi:tellurite resistance protein TerC
LAGVVERFHAVRYALARILSLVGAKILLSDVVHVPNWVSLAVVVGALSVAATVSVRFSNRHPARQAPLMS